MMCAWTSPHLRGKEHGPGNHRSQDCEQSAPELVLHIIFGQVEQRFACLSCWSGLHQKKK
jgi:hypothetical protein